MEARAALSLHAGTTELVKTLTNVGDPVIRSMDADVSSDPLLDGKVTSEPGTPIGDLGYSRSLLTGGYNWDTDAQDAAFWVAAGNLKDQPRQEQVQAWNDTLTRIIKLLNLAEHKARAWLVKHMGARSIYWPEPNTYQPASDRAHGGANARSTGQGMNNKAQQNEGALYVPSGPETISGVYDPTMATTKPVKGYFNDWAAMIITHSGEKKTPPSNDDITKLIKSVRQTHLNIDDLKKIAKKSGMPTDEISYLEDKARTVLGATIEQMAAKIRSFFA